MHATCPRKTSQGKICTNLNNKAATCDGLYSPTNTVHGRISVSSVYHQQPEQHGPDDHRLSKQDAGYYFSPILQTATPRRSWSLRERSPSFRSVLCILEKKRIDNSMLEPRETSLFHIPKNQIFGLEPLISRQKSFGASL